MTGGRAQPSDSGHVRRPGRRLPCNLNVRTRPTVTDHRGGPRPGGSPGLSPGRAEHRLTSAVGYGDGDLKTELECPNPAAAISSRPQRGEQGVANVSARYGHHVARCPARISRAGRFAICFGSEGGRVLARLCMPHPRRSPEGAACGGGRGAARHGAHAPFPRLACLARAGCSTYRLDLPRAWRVLPEFNVERL